MVRAENNYQEFESGANLYFIFSCNLAFWHPLCLIILIIIVRQEFIFLMLSAVPVQSEFKQVIEFFPPFPPMKLSLSQGLLCAQRNQKKVKNYLFSPSKQQFRWKQWFFTTTFLISPTAFRWVHRRSFRQLITIPAWPVNPTFQHMLPPENSSFTNFPAFWIHAILFPEFIKDHCFCCCQVAA